MRIRRSHNLGIDEARRRADAIAADLEERFSFRSEWRGNELMVRGNGANGRLTVDDSHIELEIRLGFALSIMEAPIRSAIEATLDEELGNR